MDKRNFLESLNEVLSKIGFQKTKSINHYIINDLKNEIKIVLWLQHSNYGKYYYVELQFIFDDEILWNNKEIKNDMIRQRLIINPNITWGKDELKYEDINKEQVIALLEDVVKSIIPYIEHGKTYLKEQILRSERGFCGQGAKEIKAKYLGIETVSQQQISNTETIFKEFVTYQIVENLMFVNQNVYEKDVNGWKKFAKEKKVKLKVVK